MAKGTNKKLKLSFLAKIMLEQNEDQHSLTFAQIMKELEKYYHVGTRKYQLAELKLLIAAIQLSKFISKTKSDELISKMKSFVIEHQVYQLQRQVYVNDRVKV